ncbi:MAG: cell division protein FtsZ, partial [Gammaproteobacteria bacterium]|nr:cell division protein FtsZ [Gammaproteobacteria bacterium]
NMVFIAAGMGGGTGTGAAPVVAKLAREKNILTVAVVTRPFAHERRDAQADAGLDQLAEYVDSLITISNDKLKDADPSFTLMNAFAAANDVLLGAVEGISDLIVSHGVMNVDFADVQTVMGINGTAMMGTGRASGESRARRAAEAAIDCPLLDDIDMRDARGVLLNVTAGPSFVLDEYYEINGMINEIASDKATFIGGLVIDESMEEEVKVTIVATGLADQVRGKAAGPRAVAIDVGSDYSEYDRPPLRRGIHDERHRKPDRDAVAADTDPEFLDLPTFLRRQAD